MDLSTNCGRSSSVAGMKKMRNDRTYGPSVSAWTKSPRFGTSEWIYPWLRRTPNRWTHEVTTHVRPPPRFPLLHPHLHLHLHRNYPQQCPSPPFGPLGLFTLVLAPALPGLNLSKNSRQVMHPPGSGPECVAVIGDGIAMVEGERRRVSFGSLKPV